MGYQKLGTFETDFSIQRRNSFKRPVTFYDRVTFVGATSSIDILGGQITGNLGDMTLVGDLTLAQGSFIYIGASPDPHMAITAGVSQNTLYLYTGDATETDAGQLSSATGGGAIPQVQLTGPTVEPVAGDIGNASVILGVTKATSLAFGNLYAYGEGSMNVRGQVLANSGLGVGTEDGDAEVKLYAHASGSAGGNAIVIIDAKKTHASATETQSFRIAGTEVLGIDASTVTITGDMLWKNSSGNDVLTIEPFAGASRHVVRIHGESAGNGPYIQIIGDNDTAADQIQVRTSGDTPLFTLDTASQILTARDSGMSSDVEIFPLGTLLEVGHYTGTTTPTSSTTLITHTVNLEYTGQPVIVMVVGMCRSSAIDENESFAAWIDIDGTTGSNAGIGQGNVTGTSNNTGNHDHGGAVGLDGAFAHTLTISVADTSLTVAPIFTRVFTPTGSSFVVKMVGSASGSPASFTESMQVIVWRG